MSGPDGEQLTLDQLPPKVRQSFEITAARLGSELTVGNLRRTPGGWAMSIYDLNGHNGGDIVVMEEPPENLIHRPPGENDPV